MSQPPPGGSPPPDESPAAEAQSGQARWSRQRSTGPEQAAPPPPGAYPPPPPGYQPPPQQGPPPGYQGPPGYQQGPPPGYHGPATGIPAGPATRLPTGPTTRLPGAAAWLPAAATTRLPAGPTAGVSGPARSGRLSTAARVRAPEPHPGVRSARRSRRLPTARRLSPPAPGSAGRQTGFDASKVTISGWGVLGASAADADRQLLQLLARHVDRLHLGIGRAERLVALVVDPGAAGHRRRRRLRPAALRGAQAAIRSSRNGWSTQRRPRSS